MRVEPKVTAMVFALLLCGLLVLPGYGAARFKSVTCQEPEMPSQAEQTMFTKGQSLYSQGLYGEAISVFNDLLKAYPKSLIRDLALLWLGRSYIRQGDVPSAEQVGLRLREIPDTPFVSFYEEELRVARQNYVRSAAPPDKSKPSRPPQRLETKSTTAEAATEGADQNQTSRGRPTKYKAAAKVETEQTELTGQRATKPPTERVTDTSSAVAATT